MIDDFDIKQIDLRTFSGIFENTTNSYKFLFFLALLDIAREKKSNEPVPFTEIVAGMLYWAWYPHTQHRLSFGKRDQVTKVLDEFIHETGHDLQPKHAKQRIMRFLKDNPARVQSLVRWVPTRFIRPFTGAELVGIPDAQVDNAVREMSADYRYERKFPYTPSTAELTFNHHWLHYFQTHFSILQSWASWYWVKYMQKANPSVPAIPAKLHPLLQRPPISAKVREHWRHFVEEVGLKCIFSAKRISPDNIHLDHFLPWKFVAHNEMWNLMPIDPGENSSKSDRIPAMKEFLEPFVEAQHEFLAYLKTSLKPGKFQNRVEGYVLDLKIEPDALFTGTRLRMSQSDLLRAYRSQMEPLEMLALNQGFQPYR